MNAVVLKSENEGKSATKRQLWALYIASRKCGQTHDYRNDNLTRKEASELLQQFSNMTPSPCTPKRKKKDLETEFLEYMTHRMSSLIETMRAAIKIKSVVEDDKEFFPNKKDRKQYAFVGHGCGISVIHFDKRSKVGTQILELSRKHRMTTFLKEFLKGFSKKEINYFQNIGCPLQALYWQDYQMSSNYSWMVAHFMESKGVKKVHVMTYDD